MVVFVCIDLLAVRLAGGGSKPKTGTVTIVLFVEWCGVEGME